MNRTKKYLPTSFRRTVISKNKSSRRDLHFVACRKAIRVFNRFTGDCLGNVYFNGEGFYFSGQLNKSIRHLDYKSISKCKILLQTSCMSVNLLVV